MNNESLAQAATLIQVTPPADEQVRRLRGMAIRCLSRREHSRAELATKLAARFEPEPDTLIAVLDRLVREDLQSDSRFAEAMIRSRVQGGKGALRIRQELGQKGVAESLIETALAEAGIDWFDLARRTADRKFGCEPPVDWAERGKRSRFLQYRGFNSDEIRYALG